TNFIGSNFPGYSGGLISIGTSRNDIIYAIPAGPAIGTASEQDASGFGDAFAIDTDGGISLPADYVSGSFMTGTDDLGVVSSIQSLGLTVGTYVYNFGEGQDADSV